MDARRLTRDVVLNKVVSSVLVPRAIRWRLLRALGLSIEGWCAIMPGVWFGGRDVTIGRDTTINYGVFVDTSAPVLIGRRVDVGMHVMIVTGTHRIGGPDRRAGAARSASVQIGDGTWLGARSVILPGVTIGEACIIAAGAVVTSDCPAGGLYAGVPARRVKELSAS
jgi:acetyltransferase-like isoleucine patch superfamily enzyme